jgi:cytochrome c2
MESRRARLAASLGAAVCAIVLAQTAVAQTPADAEAGRAVFTAKRCARCHDPGGGQNTGPPLETLRRPQGAYELAGRLWNHAPAMFTVLKQADIEWPTISADEMANLMAYLQADPKKDPAPDLAKGATTLVAKGCLKCHRFRREGGRLGPDLEERRADYAPASVWAAVMWRHAPRMAGVAIAQGMSYPRFTGDEMANLLGFLRAGPGAP